MKAGDKVTTDYYEKEKNIVRTVLSIVPDENFGSLHRVQLDGGEPCPHCGNVGTPINRVDADWCTLTVEGEPPWVTRNITQNRGMHIPWDETQSVVLGRFKKREDAVACILEYGKKLKTEGHYCEGDL